MLVAYAILIHLDLVHSQMVALKIGKRLTHPGGRPGGSGVRHGVDEAPVPDAGSTTRSSDYQ
jgi:hypothetical protein